MLRHTVAVPRICHDSAVHPDDGTIVEMMFRFAPLRGRSPGTVIPAKAVIHVLPARRLDAGFRSHDEKRNSIT
jgi:hypothetical protein